ncbi:helix-turn-helix domain-containing protein [Nostoc sp. KVJ3]|nr:helix-turn-helix domain-containing protein [Nostoc sp. KVJ3]MCW5313948.1 helix-turn-helix domain-containing protein [Nostoc sp. KVJ3]
MRTAYQYRLRLTTMQQTTIDQWLELARRQYNYRLHVCHECGLTLDRDHNAAINIKYLAVGHSVNKAQATPDGIPGVTEKPALYASASASGVCH